MLLWYSTRKTDYASILANGFKLPNADAPQNAYTFGKGIYFSDMVSKSAFHCRTDQKNNVGVFLLCDVALGTSNFKNIVDYRAANMPPNKHRYVKVYTDKGGIIKHLCLSVKCWLKDVVTEQFSLLKLYSIRIFKHY